MNLDRFENSSCCPEGISAIFSPLFDPTWHPFLAERLAVFPRSVELRDFREQPLASCWPDLATLTEDERERQIAYYTAEPSALWLMLVFDKRSGELRGSIYEDDRVLPGTLVSNAIDTESTVSELP